MKISTIYKSLVLLLYLSICKTSTAQTYEEGKYYDKRYNVSSQCTGCECKRAYWYRGVGEKTVCVLAGNKWVERKVNGTYYWFKWDIYSRCNSHKE